MTKECHNVRTSCEIRYISGDTVLYKRENSNEWRGPANVIGEINQQVFVKHGSLNIRVHPCRLQLVKSNLKSIENIDSSSNTEQHKNDLPDEPTNLPITTTENPNNSDSESELDNKSIDQETHSSHTAPTDSFSIPSSNINRDQNIQANLRIRYKTVPEDPWMEATIKSRAGKATGKYSSWWNIENDDGQLHSVHSIK